MKRNILLIVILLWGMEAYTQSHSKASKAQSGPTYETQFERSISDVMRDVERRFGVRFKYNVDTIGVRLPYADFRIRPYSLETTLELVEAIG